MTKKREWTKEEDKKLIEANEFFPGNWKMASEVVNTNKDPGECFNRVHKI